MLSKLKQRNCQKLAKILRQIKAPRQMALVLDDLLTYAETIDFLQRLAIAEALLAGEDQRGISRRLGVSIARVTRGSKAVKASKGGFKSIFKHF